MEMAMKDQAIAVNLSNLTGPFADPQIEAIRRGELGRLLLTAGHFDEALTQFERSLDLQPHDGDRWCDRAEALACLDRYDEALSSLEQAQDLAKSGMRLWVQKAALLILMSRHREALTCCNCVLQREPNHIQALLFQGVALHRQGHYRQAYRSYRRVNELTQPHSPVHSQSRSSDEPQPGLAIS